MRYCQFVALWLILGVFSAVTAQDTDLSYDKVKSEVAYLETKTANFLEKYKECRKLYKDSWNSAITQDQVTANMKRHGKCLDEAEWMRYELGWPASHIYAVYQHKEMAMDKFGYSEKQHADTKKWWDILMDCIDKIRESDKKNPTSYSFILKPEDNL